MPDEAPLPRRQTLREPSPPSGRLRTTVEKIYPIDEIKAALTHAQQARCHGKILVAPNGPVA